MLLGELQPARVLLPVGERPLGLLLLLVPVLWRGRWVWWRRG